MPKNFRQYEPLTESQRELCRANVRLAYYIAKIRFKWLKDDYSVNADDILELAWIGLCKGAQRHDPARGAFSTIACRAMHSEITAAIRCRHSKKRHPTGRVLSLCIDPSLEARRTDRGFEDIDIEDELQAIARAV